MRATVQPSRVFGLAFACALAALASCGGGANTPGSSDPPPGGNATILFDGDMGVGNPPIYKDHPDMAVAANGTQIVETTGQDINVYNYSGNLLQSTPISSFIANTVGTVGVINDPRLVYDPFISRWLFVCSCSGNYLIVSAGTDATSGWKGVALSADSGDLAMRVGFDKNGVYVVQTDIATITSKLFALPSKDVAWTAGNTVSLAHEGIAVGKTLDEVPVIDLYGSKSATASEYFVTRSSPGQTGSNIPLNLILDSVAWSSSVAS